MNKVVAGSSTRTTASSVFGSTTSPIRTAAVLAFVWLVALEFTHFACEVEQLRALRKPPVAAKPNRQNVS